MHSWMHSSPWIGVLAVTLCAALAFRGLYLVGKGVEKDMLGARITAVIGITLAGFAMYFFFFSARAGEADPHQPIAPEIAIEPIPLPVPQTAPERAKKAFPHTSKSVQEHADEADDFINQALEKAKRNQ